MMPRTISKEIAETGYHLARKNVLETSLRLFADKGKPDVPLLYSAPASVEMKCALRQCRRMIVQLRFTCCLVFDTRALRVDALMNWLVLAKMHHAATVGTRRTQDTDSVNGSCPRSASCGDASE
jgi:hypothetical protein